MPHTGGDGAVTQAIGTNTPRPKPALPVAAWPPGGPRPDFHCRYPTPIAP